jgi:hypothetical protein
MHVLPALLTSATVFLTRDHLHNPQDREPEVDSNGLLLQSLCVRGPDSILSKAVKSEKDG